MTHPLSTILIPAPFFAKFGARALSNSDGKYIFPVTVYTIYSTTGSCQWHLRCWENTERPLSRSRALYDDDQRNLSNTTMADLRPLHSAANLKFGHVIFFSGRIILKYSIKKKEMVISQKHANSLRNCEVNSQRVDAVKTGSNTPLMTSALQHKWQMGQHYFIYLPILDAMVRQYYMQEYPWVRKGWCGGTLIMVVIRKYFLDRTPCKLVFCERDSGLPQ